MPLSALILLCALASAPDYAGAEACAKCHPAEFRAQSSSAHARSLAPAKRPQPGDWAFGAGEQAITFVTKVDQSQYIEEPQSWYRRLNGYARTPGARSADGTHYRLFDPSGDILYCFSCHSTGPVSVTADEAISPQELGVRCEACHGPSAAHARNPAQVHPKQPGRLSAVELNAFCGVCHRMPVSPLVPADIRDAWNVRHQPPLLAESRCFRESKGRLTCLTCHSPHAPLERRSAQYDAACHNCHAAPRHTKPVAGRACAGCHMPEVKPQPYLAFANHRIAIYSPSDPLRSVSSER